MNKQRECWFIPYKKADNGDVLNEQSEFVHQGYFEYWGPSSRVVYSNGFPVVMLMTIGICQDKTDGQVYICPPNTIKFKITQ